MIMLSVHIAQMVTKFFNLVAALLVSLRSDKWNARNSTYRELNQDTKHAFLSCIQGTAPEAHTLNNIPENCQISQ